jgi:hypothetical protein
VPFLKEIYVNKQELLSELSLLSELVPRTGSPCNLCRLPQAIFPKKKKKTDISMSV